jgi:NTP pyrophosphatase (non-canonical NTP hydrolase)
MELSEYQKEAVKFLRSREGVEENCQLGLVGEIGEIADLIKKRKYQGHVVPSARVLEEIGDALWYAAVYLDAFGRELNAVPSPWWGTAESLVLSTAEMMANIRDPDMAEGAALYFVDQLAALAVLEGGTIEDVAAANIAKLRARYPEGFSEERSRNRE